VLEIADVIEALVGTRPVTASPVISEAAIDSRKVIPGSMFVAVPGEHVDGHDYVPQAFERGAHVALVQRDLSDKFPSVDLRQGVYPSSFAIPQGPFCMRVDDTVAALQKAAAFWRNKLNIRVIGVTGSVGKSTTKELIAEVLSKRFRTLKNAGNLNNEIGLPLTLLRLGAGHECAVLEMGFYVPGEITLLCNLARPQVGVITNIGTVHAERAGSQEVIARGKAELVEALPKDGWAILNYDDAWVRPMAEKTQAHVLYYGLDPASDLWADQIEGLGLEGIRLRLHYRNEVLHLRVPLIGRHSVHTVLRAAAAGLVEGLNWYEIITGLQHGHNQLRMVAVYTPSGALLLDDTYNASPESTLAALNLLAELHGRKVAVLGDMLELGQYERPGHEMVGVRAAEIVDELVTVGELGKMIASAARRSGLASASITSFDTVSEAIPYLKDHGFTKKDVVLVKASHAMHLEKVVSALEEES
jgi:UDP-N-acetylmuramoyl-tripeptide--D-alanyl-D-alanine ligase